MKKKVAVFMLFGQSNATGHGIPTQLTVLSLASRILSDAQIVLFPHCFCSFVPTMLGMLSPPRSYVIR